MIRFEVFVILAICISWSHCTFTEESHEECLNRVYRRNCSGTSDDSRIVTRMEKDEIIYAHNYIRRLTAEGKLTVRPGVTLPKAANMMKMKWDNELQKSAERWADYCIVDLDSCVRDKRWTVSQCWANVDRYHNWTEVVSVMFKGISNFEASEIGKYSDYSHFCAYQIIWHNMYAVGCAKTRFGSIYFYVCNYAPNEIQVGKPTYAVGNPCSKCPSGTICEKSLCALTTKRELNEEIAIAVANVEKRKTNIKKCVVENFSDISILMETLGRIIGEGGKLNLTMGEALSKKFKLMKDLISILAQFLNNLENENENDEEENYIRSWLTELYIGQTNAFLNVISASKIADINNMINKLSKVLRKIKLIKHINGNLVQNLENQIDGISNLGETYLLLVEAEGNPNASPVDNLEIKFSDIASVIEDIEKRKWQINDYIIEDLSSKVSVLREPLEAVALEGSFSIIDSEEGTIKRNNEIKEMIRTLGKEIRNLITYQNGNTNNHNHNLYGITQITNELTRPLDEIIAEAISFPEKLDMQMVGFERKVQNIAELFDNRKESQVNYKELEVELIELKNLVGNLVETVKEKNPTKGELPEHIQNKLIKMQVIPVKLLVKIKKEMKDLPEDLEVKIINTNEMLGNLVGVVENVMTVPLRELLREMTDISSMIDTSSKAENVVCLK